MVVINLWIQYTDISFYIPLRHTKSQMAHTFSGWANPFITSPVLLVIPKAFVYLVYPWSCSHPSYNRGKIASSSLCFKGNTINITYHYRFWLWSTGWGGVCQVLHRKITLFHPLHNISFGRKSLVQLTLKAGEAGLLLLHGEVNIWNFAWEIWLCCLFYFYLVMYLFNHFMSVWIHG